MTTLEMGKDLCIIGENDEYLCLTNSEAKTLLESTSDDKIKNQLERWFYANSKDDFKTLWNEMKEISSIVPERYPLESKDGNIHHYSFNKFRKYLCVAFQKFIESINGEPYILLVNTIFSKEKKSSVWATQILANYCELAKENKPVGIYSVNDFRDKILQIPEYKHIMFIDDASYSGSQLYNAISDIEKKAENKQQHIVVAVITQKAIKNIQKHPKVYIHYGKLTLYKNFYFDHKLPDGDSIDTAIVATHILGCEKVYQNNLYWDDYEPPCPFPPYKKSSFFSRTLFDYYDAMKNKDTKRIEILQPYIDYQLTKEENDSYLTNFHEHNLKRIRKLFRK
jgi:hypothetical protein